MAENHKLTLTRTIKAPREKVFEAWTKKEQLEKWYAPEGLTPVAHAYDAKQGGEFKIGMKAPDGNEYVAVGTFKEFTPPEKLVFSWQWVTNEAGAESLITVVLKEVSEGTELTFTHEMLPSEAEVAEHTKGWESCFNRLEALVA